MNESTKAPGEAQADRRLDELCREVAERAHAVAWQAFVLARQGPRRGTVDGLGVAALRLEAARKRLFVLLATRREEWDTGWTNEFAEYFDLDGTRMILVRRAEPEEQQP